MAGLEPSQRPQQSINIRMAQAKSLLPLRPTEAAPASGLLHTQLMAPCRCPAPQPNNKGGTPSGTLSIDGRTRTLSMVATTHQITWLENEIALATQTNRSLSTCGAAAYLTNGTMPMSGTRAKQERGDTLRCPPFLVWCRWPDSNRHSSRYCPLKTACLPIPPHRQILFGPRLLVGRFARRLRVRDGLRHQVWQLSGRLVASLDRLVDHVRQRIVNGRHVIDGFCSFL